MTVQTHVKVYTQVQICMCPVAVQPKVPLYKYRSACVL